MRFGASVGSGETTGYGRMFGRVADAIVVSILEPCVWIG